jgi:hypothetical protein
MSSATLLASVESLIEARLAGRPVNRARADSGQLDIEYMTLSELFKVRDQLRAEVAATTADNRGGSIFIDVRGGVT